MPELPELIVFAGNITKRTAEKNIKNIIVYRQKSLDCELCALKDRIIGRYINNVFAEGKEMYFEFSNEDVISVHLMRYGKIYLGSDGSFEDMKRKIFQIDFEEGLSLLICDPQSFCRIKYNPEINEIPDVISDRFSKEYFLNIVQKFKRKNIKTLLTDQKVMRGIGNAYADEILYKSCISPRSIVGKIPNERIDVLYFVIQDIIKWAVSEIIKADSETINGEIRDYMKVHNENLSITKKGESIHVEIISSKKTYYTDSQIIYR